MALFKWNDTYSVGVEIFDSDHKKLIEYLNQMYDLMTQKKPREEVKPVLDGLRTYTITHFKNEEIKFKLYDYPDIESHKREHIGFIEKVEEFYKEYNSGKLMLNMEVLNFLTNWLKKHIKGSDQKYKSFFNEKGLS